MKVEFEPEKINPSNYTMSITMPYGYWLTLRKQLHSSSDMGNLPAQWFIDKITVTVKEEYEYLREGHRA